MTAAGTTDSFLEELATWAESTAQDVDGESENAELLCDLAHDHLGLDLAELTPGDLRELLLRVFPRKITVADRADLDTVIPTMRAVCGFLRDTGRIKPQQHDRLIRELDDIEPRFADAVMDPANWGMARTITQSMLADGIDVANQDDATQSLLFDFAGIGEPGLTGIEEREFDEFDEFDEFTSSTSSTTKTTTTSWTWRRCGWRRLASLQPQRGPATCWRKRGGCPTGSGRHGS